jgi:hypothetical protein
LSSRAGLELRHTQTVTGIGAFDVTAYGGFAGNGIIHYIADDTVYGAPDPPKDGVDRNCDERD